MDPQKQQLMQSFLRDASNASSNSNTGNTNNSLVRVDPSTNFPDMPASLEQFKEFVRTWLELDNTIKKAQKVIKEKRLQRNQLSLAISKFMCKYDIEDLNTKEGRIRCKVTQVKAPVNQKVVKEKLTNIFQGNEERSQEIYKKLYEERDTIQKVSLRRLRIE